MLQLLTNKHGPRHALLLFGSEEQDEKTVEFGVSDEARQPGYFIQSVSTQWRWSGSQQSGYFIYVSEANHLAPQLWPIKKLLSTIRSTHCVLIFAISGVMVDSIMLLRIAESE